jgi:hypothetical protein
MGTCLQQAVLKIAHRVTEREQGRPKDSDSQPADYV